MTWQKQNLLTNYTVRERISSLYRKKQKVKKWRLLGQLFTCTEQSCILLDGLDLTGYESSSSPTVFFFCDGLFTALLFLSFRRRLNFLGVCHSLGSCFGLQALGLLLAEPVDVMSVYLNAEQLCQSSSQDFCTHEFFALVSTCPNAFDLYTFS